MPKIAKSENRTLKDEIIKAIIADEALQGKIASELGKSTYSVKRWLKPGFQHHLAKPVIVGILKAYWDLKPSENLWK